MTEGYSVSTIRRRQRKTRFTISTPDDIYRLMTPILNGADREHFYVILLTTKNAVISVELVSVGSLSANLVHPREVFKPALIASAACVVAVHNHPSGDPGPSKEDIEFTKRLRRAGDILGVKVLDHVILGNGDYCSLEAEGQL